MNEPIFLEKFTIRHSEADLWGRLKLRACFDYLQEAAANHATRLGFGLENMSNHRLLWVLSKIRIEFFRESRIGDTLQVRTYPSGFERLFARRQFELTNQNGEIVARSSSWWIILSAEKLRPMKPDALPAPMPENCPEECFFTDLEAMETLSLDQWHPCFDVTPRFSQFDINQHTNNAEYAGWLEDALYCSGTCRADKRIAKVQLQFLQALKPGATAKITLAGSSHCQVSGTLPDGRLCFIGQADLIDA